MESQIKRFFEETAKTKLSKYHAFLRGKISEETREHGKSEEWNMILDSIENSEDPISTEGDLLRIGDGETDYSNALIKLKPWRKGPLRFGSTVIETEWRSDWKWERIKKQGIDLSEKFVLDIGAGNGYYLFRMLGAGAKVALGIDPTILFNYQFAAMQKVSSRNNAFLLPLRSEHLPAFEIFDVVFCLGVLYHRRSPIDQLKELRSFLKPRGILVLETLILPEKENREILIPKDTYAKMSNVWFIPSEKALQVMLQRSGFSQIEAVDVTRTSLQEQRTTKWMDFQSLSDFLDPQDPDKTIEGYPAPTRALIIATKP